MTIRLMALGLLLVSVSSEAQIVKSMTVREFFNALNKDSLHLVDEFYSPQVEFRDPIGSLKGSDRMKDYYRRMYSNVTSIRFDFTSEVFDGRQVVAAWTMHLQAAGLNRGEPVIVDGISHLRYDEPTHKVVYHRDYFDMGAFIYEHIPLLGWGVRKIRERMALH